MEKKKLSLQEVFEHRFSQHLYLTAAKIGVEEMDDFRQENSVDSVEHLLLDILIIAILGTIYGANGYAQIYR
jgi:hypothetical protein